MREIEAVWNSRSATVQVVPGSDAATRLLKRRGTVADGATLTLHFADANILADELSGYGPEVLVEAPPELRDAVRQRLEQTARLHSGAYREADHRG